MALKFHSSMAKWLKVKVRKFGDRPIPFFAEVTGEKLVGMGRGGRRGGERLPPILNRVRRKHKNISTEE